MLGAQPGTAEVDPHDPVEVLDRGLQQRREVDHAGVGHQFVHTAEGFDARPHHGDHLIFVGDVRPVGDGTAADLRGGRLRRVAVDVRAQYPGTFVGQPLGDRQADPGPCSGDDRGLAGQVGVGHPATSCPVAWGASHPAADRAGRYDSTRNPCSRIAPNISSPSSGASSSSLTVYTPRSRRIQATVCDTHSASAAASVNTRTCAYRAAAGRRSGPNPTSSSRPRRH